MVCQEHVVRMERLTSVCGADRGPAGDLSEVLQAQSGDIYRMVLASKRLVETAKPGQFLNIRCGDSLEAYLRRPISICDVNPENGTVDIVFQVKGAGTERLSRLKAGDVADVMGPLGSSFRPVAPGGQAVVVGGGIGTFPLLYLLRSMPNVRRTALLGFRSREAVVLEEAFAGQCERLDIATDDGSYGTPGFVTSLLKQRLAESSVDMVYVCGPTPMMKAAVSLCLDRNVPVQVSMEQRMGCGVGACLVCACKKKQEDGFQYTHVCREGPIFDGRDILFD